MPPPPAPQWFACAWPIVILRSRFGDLVVQPDRRAARGDADVRVRLGVARLVLEERDAHALHAREVLLADLLLGVGLGHREDLAVRADDDGVGDAGGLERVEDGGQQARLRRRPELVVDHDRDASPPLRAAREKRGPGDRVLERVRGAPRSRRARPRARRGRSRRAGSPAGCRARACRGRPSSSSSGRTDRQRVERLVRNGRPVARPTSRSSASLNRSRLAHGHSLSRNAVRQSSVQTMRRVSGRAGPAGGPCASPVRARPRRACGRGSAGAP